MADIKNPYVEIVETFQVFQKDTLIMESERTRDCMEFFFRSDLKKIWFSDHYGYNRSLEFLKDYPFVKRVFLKGPFDISGLYYLQDLEYINYNNDNKSQVFDFARFKNIKTCYFDLHSRHKNIDNLTEVEKVRFFHYSPREKNLISLAKSSKMEELFISMSNIESLSGIENFQQLKYIDLHYMRNLRDIRGVVSVSQTLECFQISNSKKIEGFFHIGELSNLKELALNSCNPIPSIEFIKKLTKLQDFRFVATDVLDGNVKPLLRLDSFAFTDRPHFSNKEKDLIRLHAEQKGGI